MDVVRAAVVAPFGAVAHRSRLGDEGVRARIEPDGFPYANSVDAIRPADVAAVDRQARARLVRIGAHVDAAIGAVGIALAGQVQRSEEHTSELQSLMRISYAVFCLKQKIKTSNSRHA